MKHSSHLSFTAPLATAVAITLGASLATSTALTAQFSTPPTIIGLTDASPFVARINPAICNAGLCNPTLSPVTVPYAGGTAHDGTDGFTWISNGLSIEKVDLRSGCATICPPTLVPFAGPGAEVTGLAFHELSRRLFVSYADNRIATFQATGTCGLTPASICNAPVPSNHIITGLAINEVGGELFYSSSPFLGPFPVGVALLHRAQIGAPCAPICSDDLADCAGIQIPRMTGLAYDGCRRTLFVTDGDNLYSVALNPPCGAQVFNCCFTLPNTAGELLVGLCILPPAPTSTGPTCFGGVSPICPGMTHSLNGDAVLGNLGFSIDLTGAPSGSFAYLFLDLGAPGPGVFSPPLCSGILVTNFFSAFVVAGPPGCNGSASQPFPLPILPFLCGITLSTQWIGEIPPALSGDYVTPALTWTITSS